MRWWVAVVAALMLASCQSGSSSSGVDVRAPQVSNITPSNNATGVLVNSGISVTFSEAMVPASVTTASFTLWKAGPIASTAITGTVNYVGTTATFTPGANLDYDSTYTATITTAAKDLAGNPLAANYVWSFTTGPAPDTTPPQVSSTTPAGSATNIAINSALSATFSEALTPATVSTASFTLDQAGTPVSGTVGYSGTTATFTPDAALVYSTLYTATLTTAVQDLAGNALASTYTWNFTTGPMPDTTAPTVTATSPDGATAVSVGSSITADFSEALNPATVTTASFTLDQAGTPVSGTVGYSGTTATFTPDAALAYSTLYTATLTTAVRDLAGNAIAASSVWTFTTGSAPDTTAPTVTGVSPADSATVIAPNSTVTATFSETMNGATLTTGSFTVTGPGGAVAGSVGYSGLIATFSPASALGFNTTYAITVTTSARDTAGNPLATDYLWGFTTSGPFMTVYGVLCASPTPTPGCTFNVGSGTRASVSQDPAYNSSGNGSDDMWYVQFDSSGRASVYNDLNVFQYFANPSEFAGYISGTTIGVGANVADWENIASRQYWFGSNGVLYSANTGSSNYGRAIN
jgi:hypothetical protein